MTTVKIDMTAHFLCSHRRAQLAAGAAGEDGAGCLPMHRPAITVSPGRQPHPAPCVSVSR